MGRYAMSTQQKIQHCSDMSKSPQINLSVQCNLSQTPVGFVVLY